MILNHCTPPPKKFVFTRGWYYNHTVGVPDMAEHVLLIDSSYEEAEGFVRGLEEATASPWEVELYPNNTTYGLRRYLKFFTVALHVVTHPARYSGKTLLCWQQFYGIAIAFFCRLFHLKKRFRLVIMTFIYKPKSGFAGRLFERFVRYAVTSDAVDRILLTTRAEAPRYAETFGLPLSRFGFAHCGSLPHDPAAYDDPALKAQDYYFATGRSNRDYDFLIRAFRGRPETLCIACDVLAPCPEPNVQVEPLLFGQAGEGFDKWGVAENNGIAAYCQQVFFLRLRCIEIFIFCAEWVVLLVCEVVKGYFSFVFPVPRPNRRIHGVADNNSTKGMECVNDMLLVFFCTGHGNFPLSSTNAWIEI